MDDAIKVRRGATAHIENALVIGNGQMKDFIDVTDSKGICFSSPVFMQSIHRAWKPDILFLPISLFYEGFFLLLYRPK